MNKCLRNIVENMQESQTYLALTHTFKLVFIDLQSLSLHYRAKKVFDGVNHAAKMFPNAYVIMIIIGAVKGNGEAFVRVGERLLRGVWTPEAVEFLRPSL